MRAIQPHTNAHPDPDAMHGQMYTDAEAASHPGTSAYSLIRSDS